jgi:hypothetical protein
MGGNGGNTMIKIYHKNSRGGYNLRHTVSFTEAAKIMKDLFEQHLTAEAYDEDYPDEIIGRVYDNKGSWEWFCK